MQFSSVCNVPSSNEFPYYFEKIVISLWRLEPILTLTSTLLWSDTHQIGLLFHNETDQVIAKGIQKYKDVFQNVFEE